MDRFSGRQTPWHLAGSAQLDPYATTLETYSVSPAGAAATPRSLADKVEGLIQTAEAQADHQTARTLAAVLRNLQGRVSRLPARDPGEPGALAGEVHALRRVPEARPANDP